MRRLETTIDIDASPEAVWSVLTDSDRYPDWNPFVRSIDGELREGSRIRVRIEPPKGRGITLRPTVKAVRPERELRWLGRLGLPRIFDGEHEFHLEPLDEGRRTRFVQAETFRGVLVPFVGRLLVDTKAGFVAMNEALRDRVGDVAACAR